MPLGLLSAFTIHSVTTSHTLWSHTAPLAFYTASCCLVLPALSLVTSQWDALPRHCREGGGVLTGLLHHSGNRCHVTTVEGAECWLPVTSQWETLPCHRGGGGGRLHSANTSQYVPLVFLSFQYWNFKISEMGLSFVFMLKTDEHCIFYKWSWHQ
jgi:hypothetical protein